MNQIEQIIQTALHSEVNEVRIKAEQELYILVDQNNNDFFLTISRIIGD